MRANLLPYLKISGPEGQSFETEISGQRITVGRFREFNDIGLEPDPQQLVTRKGHCAIEREAGTWWVIDNGSVNKTFLVRNGQMGVVNGRSPLNEGCVIRILGKITESGQPLYWELAFFDPQGTNRAETISRAAFLEYDWLEARLYRVEGNNRQEIQALRPQEHKLLRYMDQRNRANGGVAVMCNYEELLQALWGEEPGHTELEINHLVWELRKKVELDPKDPRFLQTVKGLGYRLITRPYHP